MREQPAVPHRCHDSRRATVCMVLHGHSDQCPYVRKTELGRDVEPSVWPPPTPEAGIRPERTWYGYLDGESIIEKLK